MNKKILLGLLCCLIGMQSSYAQCDKEKISDYQKPPMTHNRFLWEMIKWEVKEHKWFCTGVGLLTLAAMIKLRR